MTSSRAQLASWDERINQARVACNAWQIECEESKRKTALAEQQRDEVRKYVCKTDFFSALFARSMFTIAFQD